MEIDKKISLIRFKKRLGVIVYGMILATAIIIAAISFNSKLDALAIMQSDTLNKINDLSVQIDEQVQTVAIPVNVAETACYPLTIAERDVVERVIAAEARGESLEGMMAVAQVIRDRSQLWGKNVEKVVSAKGQFAKPYSGKISEDIKLAVANVFDDGQSVFAEPVTHFYSGNNEPYWVDEKVNRGNIGRHKFYF